MLVWVPWGFFVAKNGDSQVAIDNIDSALRLLGALLMEQDEEWAIGRHYFRMDAYWEHKRSESNDKPTETESQRNTAA